MPVTGWLMTGAANSTISWFGLFPIPNIAAPNKEFAEIYADRHAAIGTIIWIFLALHVGGALKHVFIDRDNTLKRMLPALALLLLTAVPAHAVDVPPTPWLVQRDLSKLSFEATQEGTAFTGEFAAFDGTIVFDPKDPQKGTAQVLIDLGSITSGNAERDKTVVGHDWFDTDTNPSATFSVDYFDKGEKEGDYVARGRLILRGIEKAIDLPFHLTITEKDGMMTAHATGEVTIKRLDFAIGEGQWADPATVGDAVVIKIDITATKRTDAD
jgi:polyisoprenoid-binding protein YceI